MDLTQLANLGEFIGGIAVLVTLVYLALQVKQNTAAQNRAAEIATADAFQKVVNTYSTFRQMLADEGLAGVLAKAQSGADLSDVERIRLRALVSELTYSGIAASWNYRVAGVDPADREIPFVLIAREVGDAPAMRQAWAGMEAELREIRRDAFADGVVARLANAENPLHSG